jgi:hypothetical protein
MRRSDPSRLLVVRWHNGRTFDVNLDFGDP